ncbi:MAG: hypothetical protein GY855_02435 [candidate division Zixibacteria bacterium]|nr:hypothetical protein [candidate division Zixibacteria bacterium]
MITTITGEYPNKALTQASKEELSGSDLKQVRDDAVIDVIKQMESAGLDIITDGMIRWPDPVSYIARRFDGAESGTSLPYFNTDTNYIQPIIKNGLKWNSPITVDDYKFASSKSNKKVKAVLTGPFTLAKLSADEYYNDITKLTEAFAVCLNSEMRELQKAGCDHIAINEPGLVNFHDETVAFFDTAPALLDGIEITTAIFTYFGVIGKVYSKLFELPFDIIGLDFVINERNWDFIPQFPDDKILSFGIINGSNAEIEDKEDIIDALSDITEFILPERLHVNPNCGLTNLSPEIAYRKINNMTEIVKEFKK